MLIMLQPKNQTNLIYNFQKNVLLLSCELIIRSPSGISCLLQNKVLKFAAFEVYIKVGLCWIMIWWDCQAILKSVYGFGFEFGFGFGFGFEFGFGFGFGLGFALSITFFVMDLD